MNDYLRGYIDGYIEKSAGLFDNLFGSKDKSFLTKTKDYWNQLSDAEKYSILAGTGALAGAGIGSAVAKPNTKLKGALIGAGSGAVVGPAALYIAQKIQEYRNNK